jgi:hypothetical protein
VRVAREVHAWRICSGSVELCEVSDCNFPACIASLSGQGFADTIACAHDRDGFCVLECVLGLPVFFG